MKKTAFKKRVIQLLDTVFEDYDEEDLAFSDFWTHFVDEVDDLLEAEIDDKELEVEEDEDEDEDF